MTYIVKLFMYLSIGISQHFNPDSSEIIITFSIVVFSGF